MRFILLLLFFLILGVIAQERLITYYADYQGNSLCWAGLRRAAAKQYLFRASQNYTDINDHEVWDLKSFYFTYAPPSTYTFYAIATFPGRPDQNLVCTTYREGTSCNAGAVAGSGGGCVAIVYFTFQADIPLVIGQGSDTVGNFSLQIAFDSEGCSVPNCQEVVSIINLREEVFKNGGAYSCWPYKSFLYTVDSSSKRTYWATVEYNGRILNMTCSGSTCILSPTFKFAIDTCSWTITLAIISSSLLPFESQPTSIPVKPAPVSLPVPVKPVPVKPAPISLPVPGPGMVNSGHAHSYIFLFIVTILNACRGFIEI